MIRLLGFVAFVTAAIISWLVVAGAVVATLDLEFAIWGLIASGAAAVTLSGGVPTSLP